MSGYISSNGSDLSTIFAKNIVTNDISFSSLTTFSKGIISSYVVATGNISISSNYPNIILIDSPTAFNITLPTNPSRHGIMIQVRQISGTTALTMGYPNGIRLGNILQTTGAYMNYNLCTLQDNTGNNWWYVFYRP